MANQTALVLFSGGLDSTTLLAFLLDKGWQCHAISFDYGQRHAYELAAAADLAKSYGCQHTVVNCGIPILADNTSALLDHSRSLHEEAEPGPVASYVPARNAIFLAYALSIAEQLSIRDIFIGANADDKSNYPDCRPEFYAAFQAAARLSASDINLNITAPFAEYSKRDIVLLAKRLDVDIAETVSCYNASALAPNCQICAACKLRAKAFAAANIADASIA